MRRFLATLLIVLGISMPALAFAATLTEEQVQSIIGLAQSFGAETSVIVGVEAALRGKGTPTSGGVTAPTVTPLPPAGSRDWAICKRITNQDVTVSQGTRGDTIREMQEFLASEGEFKASTTGYFGSVTAQALGNWQLKNGIVPSADPAVGWGSFGPKTKERVRHWCGGWQNKERFSATPTEGEPPLGVTFSTWLSGFRIKNISYSIDFGDGTSERASDCLAPADACISPGQNKHTYTSTGTYIATLHKITDPCPDDGDPSTPRCLAAVQNEVVGKVHITVGKVACTKEYAPVCGQPTTCNDTLTTSSALCVKPDPKTFGNKCMMNAESATFLYEGACRVDTKPFEPDASCKAWYDGCNDCSRSTPGGIAACTLRACVWQAPGYCKERFDGVGNKPPAISAFSGPTTLGVSTTGTWTVKASDPENGPLTYLITWGDESLLPALGAQPYSADSFTQSTTFTHMYNVPGIYTVIVVVKDSTGAMNKATATVKVGEMVTYCTQDAKQCFDGTWVGRTGPNCEFKCPVSATY